MTTSSVSKRPRSTSIAAFAPFTSTSLFPSSSSLTCSPHSCSSFLPRFIPSNVASLQSHPLYYHQHQQHDEHSVHVNRHYVSKIVSNVIISSLSPLPADTNTNVDKKDDEKKLQQLQQLQQLQLQQQQKTARHPGNQKGYKHSSETKRKISYSMLGQRKSEEMKAKVSEKLKGRIPWNKGKKLSEETRDKMRQAASGRQAWNKGINLSAQHKLAISMSSLKASRTLSNETKLRMRLAKRRHGDLLVEGNFNHKRKSNIGHYKLLDSNDINSFISLRRELSAWFHQYLISTFGQQSYEIKKHNFKRLSLSYIRKHAPVPVIRKFEKYCQIRDSLRGLAADVYGHIDPNSMPTVSTRDLSDRSNNNNSNRKIITTKHGNNRIVSPHNNDGEENNARYNNLQGSEDDMWDMYDRPYNSYSRKNIKNDNNNQINNSLIGVHVLKNNTKTKDNDELSVNDFRKIGRHRLMETMDINKYIRLRRDLKSWSNQFKETHGRTPSLSDAKQYGTVNCYQNFCDYLSMRERMEGLVQEVCGTEVDDLETLSKLNAEGKEVLDTLRSSKTNELKRQPEEKE